MAGNTSSDILIVSLIVHLIQSVVFGIRVSTDIACDPQMRFIEHGKRKEMEPKKHIT